MIVDVERISQIGLSFSRPRRPLPAPKPEPKGSEDEKGPLSGEEDLDFSGDVSLQCIRGQPTRDQLPDGGALRLGAAGGGCETRSSGAGPDFSRPGSMSFWVAPRDWKPTSTSYARFLLVPGADTATFNLQRDYRPRDAQEEVILVGLFELPGRSSHFVRVRTPLWSRGSWHLVALRWDRVGFGVSIDGGVFLQQGVPEQVWRRTFGGAKVRGAATWGLGDAGRETSLIRDLRVYGRPMREDEARSIAAARLHPFCRRVPVK